VSTPAAKAETGLFTFPTLPMPPSIRSVSLKGPSASSGGFFSGGCSARGEEVELTDEWVTLTEGGSKECRVIYYVSPDAIVIARDGRGEFFLKPGIGRNPRAIKLVAGNAHFKYSTCDSSSPSGILNWDCTVH
jgi:hypothetical protein